MTEVVAQTVPDSLQAAAIVDDADAGQVQITAYWARITSEAADSLYGSTALHDGGVGADGVVHFLPELEQSGRYEVYLHVPVLKMDVGAVRERPRLATNAPVFVRSAGGTAQVTVDMRAHAGTWVRLGTYLFCTDDKSYVAVRNDAADGYVVADAVMFVPINS